MKLKRFFLLLSFLAVCVFLFCFNMSAAKDMTTAEIQALIQSLQQQIAELQKQLTGTEEKPTAWCFDFDVNLRVGDTTAITCYLQTALQKEGFETEIEKTAEGSCKFNEELASAISGFQQKYADEILKPLV